MNDATARLCGNFFYPQTVIRNHGVRAFGKVAILLIYSNLINILLKLLRLTGDEVHL